MPVKNSDERHQSHYAVELLESLQKSKAKNLQRTNAWKDILSNRGFFMSSFQSLPYTQEQKWEAQLPTLFSVLRGQ